MKTDKKTRAAMTDRMNWLKSWAQKRNYDIGDKRRDFIFIYYSTLRVIYPPKIAQQMVLNINQRFVQPLEENVIGSTIRTVNATGGYRLQNQTIINTLGITPAEVDALRIGHNLREQSERTQRKLDRLAQEEQIIALYQKGKRLADMAADFPELSQRTIERIVQKHAKEKKLERDRTIWLLADSGKSISYIAEQVKCSKPTV